MHNKLCAQTATMRISVIIPTYNESAGIAETLAHVYSQVRKPDEVIVVDDSTDDTPQKVLSLSKKYTGLRLVKGGRLGVSAAKNLGAKNSKGDVLVFLDADILLGTNCLAVLEKKFRDKSINLAYKWSCSLELSAKTAFIARQAGTL